MTLKPHSDDLFIYCKSVPSCLLIMIEPFKLKKEVLLCRT